MSRPPYGAWLKAIAVVLVRLSNSPSTRKDTPVLYVICVLPLLVFYAVYARSKKIPVSFDRNFKYFDIDNACAFSPSAIGPAKIFRYLGHATKDLFAAHITPPSTYQFPFQY